MSFGEIIRMVFALAVTLGLVGLASVAMRRFGPEAMSRIHLTRKERRLSIVETLILDPARRLVLVRLDGEERLILLGDGRVLDAPRPVARRRKTPETAA